MAQLPPATHRPLLTKESNQASKKDRQEQKKQLERETTPEAIAARAHPLAWAGTSRRQ